MSEQHQVSSGPAVEVDDKVLAKLAAFQATQTPGVARLHPYLIQAARNAVTSAAKRAAAKLGGSEDDVDSDVADPAAVEVDRDADTGTLTLTVRIVASTQPPILSTVGDLQRRVRSCIIDVTGLTPVVVVLVLDVDPPPAA